MSLYKRQPNDVDNPPFNSADITARGGGSGAIVWAVIALLIAVVLLWAAFSFIF